jgi:AmmeMemoRadiSam system protein A
MSPPREAAAHIPEGIAQEFSDHERGLLLEIAHLSIESELNQRPFLLDPPSERLAQLRGVFTTLYLQQRLRGCVGYFEPIKPLHVTVAETARAAAFNDTRFQPVSLREAPELEISLSILSPLRPVRAEEIEIGVHGLVVTRGAYRGLLLPQVAVEHNWDRVTFLQQTCRKAGLSADAWTQGVLLRAFTAEVFGDVPRSK